VSADRRSRKSRSEWVEIIGKMQESGLTQKEYCAKQGINYRAMLSMKSTLAKCGLNPSTEEKGLSCKREDGDIAAKKANWIKLSPSYQEASPAYPSSKFSVTINISSSSFVINLDMVP